MAPSSLCTAFAEVLLCSKLLRHALGATVSEQSCSPLSTWMHLLLCSCCGRPTWPTVTSCASSSSIAQRPPELGNSSKLTNGRHLRSARVVSRSVLCLWAALAGNKPRLPPQPRCPLHQPAGPQPVCSGGSTCRRGQYQCPNGTGAIITECLLWLLWPWASVHRGAGPCGTAVELWLMKGVLLFDWPQLPDSSGLHRYLLGV